MQGEKRYIKLEKAEEVKLGKGILEIADIFQVTRQTITRWFNRYE
jgi:transposase